MPYFYASYDYAAAAKDSTVMIFSLRDIGRCYSEIKNIKKGIIYYEKAGFLINKTKLYKLKETVYSELSYLYAKEGQYKKALNAYHFFDDGKSPLAEPAPSYSNTAFIFKKMNVMDSAIYYYKKGFDGGNPYSKRGISLNLKDVFIANGNYVQANIYADSCLVYTDSICNIALSENKNLIRSLNDKLTIEKDISKLRKNIIIHYCPKKFSHRVS